MTRAMVLYDTRYGNTQAAAVAIAEGFGERDSATALVARFGEVTLRDVIGYELLVIGTPNHLGRATRRTLAWVKGLRGLPTRPSLVATFDTCLLPDQGKAAGQIVRAIRQAIPDPELPIESISLIVDGIHGPLHVGEVERSREFGRKLAGRVRVPRTPVAPTPEPLSPAPPSR
jgi:flavorubredoxin